MPQSSSGCSIATIPAILPAPPCPQRKFRHQFPLETIGPGSAPHAVRLEHSRSRGGSKEPKNINNLADEYLRLAYHGMRAKDKTFSAAMNTKFDDSTGKINIIAQDIGRVLLNLFNNAFYAVAEKAKTAGAGYQPTVTISTKRKDNAVIIAVSDNGNGIPKNITDKIFQPFFTTKPTGQGTGLGLSLSYDIIKAHGGELKVDTKEGEYAEFTIQLPVARTSSN